MKRSVFITVLLSAAAGVITLFGALLLIGLSSSGKVTDEAGWNAYLMLPSSVSIVVCIILIILDFACIAFALALIISDLRVKKAISNNEKEEKKSRFSRLNRIDADVYKREKIPYNDRIELKELCEDFRNFAASEMGLFYDASVIRAFVAAMSCTHLIIIQGISGTGKTSLPFAFGKFIQSEASVTPVQPSWKDRSDLLGYYNEFTDSYTETELLCRLYEANLTDEIYMIVLDEMNIARVEYYFAEFLSLLELPDGTSRRVRVTADSRESDPALFKNGTLSLSSNVFFVGTANNDDSTLSISDKVCDRAFIIELNKRSKPFFAQSGVRSHISYSRLKELYGAARAAHPLSEQMRSRLTQLDEYLINNIGITFGNRVMRQAESFIPVYVSCGGTWEEAADLIIRYKILGKMDALDPLFCRGEEKGLTQTIQGLFGDGKMPLCVSYLKKFRSVV